MKKTITKETHICDQCGKEESYINACVCCGKELCCECWQKHGMKYNHSVYYQGSGDGYYCNQCDKKLISNGKDKRHAAYRSVMALRKELEIWCADFKKRQEEADNAVKFYIGH